MSRLITRRSILRGGLLGGAGLVLTGCDALGQSESFRDILGLGEDAAYHVQRLLGSNALAPEFQESEMSPVFRTNGNTMPSSEIYQAEAKRDFSGWRLSVDGLVDHPKSFSLDELRAMPARTQITRHDCVEGWSAIGKWTGVPLGSLLAEAGVKPQARYAVFHCADDFDGTPYYESIDLVDARHPQTILAYAMNDATLAVGHGAPLRLRVERQLGYKQAKYIMRVELVSSLLAMGQGKGGFWEDEIGYDWYAGI